MIASFAFAIAGLATGIIAAFFWLKSAKVRVNPPYMPGNIPPAPDVENIGWVIGILEAMQASASPNQKAAIWTGVSTLLNGLAAVSGTWPFN